MALLNNFHLSRELERKQIKIDSFKTLYIRDWLIEYHDIEKWHKNVVLKRSNKFEPCKIQELQAMLNNKKDYISGNWVSFVDKVNVIRRRNRVMKSIDFNKPIADQLGKIKEGCRSEKLDFFEIIKQINDRKAEVSIERVDVERFDLEEFLTSGSVKSKVEKGSGDLAKKQSNQDSPFEGSDKIDIIKNTFLKAMMGGKKKEKGRQFIIR